MKMLFLFASLKGFNTYLPILSALLEKGYIVSTSIVGASQDTSFRTQSVIEEQRAIAWRETKNLNLDILFCEKEFTWLGIGHSHKECILKPDLTFEEIMKEIQKYNSYALA